MSSDSKQQRQAVYSSNDVAVTLKIQESTLRKYCLILEKAGYGILKNAHGHRAFFDDDIIIIKKFIELKNGSDMTLEQSAKAVITWKNGNSITTYDMEEFRYVARYNDLVEEFKTFKSQQKREFETLHDQQINFNKELINELKKQQEYIDNHLKQRDQALLFSIKETMEARREIAATKSRKWWKFWK